MASTYSTNLAIELIGTGDQAGTWGVTTNTNLGTLIEQAISGYVTQAVATGTDTTITIPNGATGVARNMYIELTGTGGTNTNLIVPANKKLYFIFNNTASGQVTVKVSGQTGVSVPNGAKMILVSNGTDIVDATNYIGNISAESANITTLTGTTLIYGSASITGATITSAFIPTLTANSATITSATITGLASPSANLTRAVIGSASVTGMGVTSAAITTLTGTTLIYGSASISNATVTSAFIPTLTGTNANITSATVTNLAVTSAVISNLTLPSTTVTNLTATSATITTLTGTTLIYGSASITGATVTSAFIPTLTGTNATITTLSGTTLVYGSASITGATVTSAFIPTLTATSVNGVASAGITRLVATSASITTVSGTTLIYGSASLTGATVTSAFIPTLTGTNATITTLSGTTLVYGSASITGATVTSAFIPTLTGTNANITSATVTTLSGTTLIYGSASITGATVTSAFIPTLTATSSTITTITSTSATITSITTTNLRGVSSAGVTRLTATSASITGLSVTSAAIGKFTAGSSAVSNLFASGTIAVSGTVLVGRTDVPPTAGAKAALSSTGDTALQVTKEGVVAGRVMAVTTGLGFGVDLVDGATERMRLTQNGRLSIGSTSENAILYVNGGAIDEILRLEGTGSPYLSIYDTGVRQLYLEAGADNVNFYVEANKGLSIATNNTERMRILAGGDIVIGQTAVPLTGDGQFFNQTGRWTTRQGSGGQYASFLNSSGTQIGFIQNSGNSTTVYSTSSDRRLKENIVPADDAGAVIDAIEVVKHDWKVGGHARYGVVAQDLHEVVPEAVSVGDNGEEIEKIWGVDYSKLVPMLIKEVQSLRKRVAELEAK